MQTDRPKRPRQLMSDLVREAVVRRDLMEAYRPRPPYQQNDYLGWIARTKRPETREKRLEQMLDVFAGGDRYMNMPYGGGARRSPGQLALPCC
jgi:uncharacterized protein YdeI (YjbR/CyaY-like superfamily)